MDFLLPADQGGDSPLPIYVLNARERLRLAYAVVQEALQRSAETASAWYSRKVKHHKFLVGDKLRVFCPLRFCGQTPKWQNFIENTGQILARLNDATYVVKLDRGGVKKIFSYRQTTKLIKE